MFILIYNNNESWVIARYFVPRTRKCKTSKCKFKNCWWNYSYEEKHTESFDDVRYQESHNLRITPFLLYGKCKTVKKSLFDWNKFKCRVYIYREQKQALYFLELLILQKAIMMCWLEYSRIILKLSLSYFIMLSEDSFPWFIFDDLSTTTALISTSCAFHVKMFARLFLIFLFYWISTTEYQSGLSNMQSKDVFKNQEDELSNP